MRCRERMQEERGAGCGERRQEEKCIGCSEWKEGGGM